MTETPGATSEPTLSDVMAAVRDNATQLAALSEVVRQGFGLMMTELSGVKADIATGVGQVRADVAELKVEFALLEARVDDAHRAILRHGNDPNAHPNAA